MNDTASIDQGSFLKSSVAATLQALKEPNRIDLTSLSSKRVSSTASKIIKLLPGAFLTLERPSAILVGRVNTHTCTQALDITTLAGMYNILVQEETRGFIIKAKSQPFSQATQFVGNEVWCKCLIRMNEQFFTYPNKNFHSHRISYQNWKDDTKLKVIIVKKMYTSNKIIPFWICFS